MRKKWAREGVGLLPRRSPRLSCPLLLLPAKLLFSSSFLIFLLMLILLGKGFTVTRCPCWGEREHSRDRVAGQGGRAEIGFGEGVATPSSLTAPTPAVSPHGLSPGAASATQAR